MPRKSAAAPEAPSAVPAPAPPPQSIPLAEPSAWSDILGEVSADADVRIAVYREPDTGQGGAAFLFTVEAGDFAELSDLLAHIKAHADGGPGLYSLRAKKGTRFMGAPRVRIGGRKIEAAPPPPSTTAPAAAPSQALGMDFLEKLVLALIARPQPATNGASLGEIAQVFEMLNANRTPPPDPVDQLKKAFELKKLIAPEANDDDDGDTDARTGRTMWDALSVGLDALGKAVTASPPPAAAPAPAPQPNPAPAIAAPRPAPAPAPATGPQLPPALRILLGMLLQGAKMESEAEAYAVLVLDQLGDQAPALLANPQALDTLCGLEPRFNAVRPWLSSVIEAARELLRDDDEPEAPGADLTASEAAADGPGNVDRDAAAVP